MTDALSFMNNPIHSTYGSNITAAVNQCNFTKEYQHKVKNSKIIL